MKKIIISASLLLSASGLFAQSAIDGFNLARQDMRGTARFMSMGGAFGALGGDMTTLSYNPAGIGVYRSSEIGFTMSLDCNQANMNFYGNNQSDNKTTFLFNNAGYIGTAKLSSALRNFNWGFTYNRTASFNRRFSGVCNNIGNSMSNYIAALANNDGAYLSDLQGSFHYDPYMGNNEYAAPWITILGYDSHLISPTSDNNEKPDFTGLYREGETRGSSSIQMLEQGGIDEYNFALGGNFGNLVYWGMDFGILDVNYTRQSLYSESLKNAWVGEDTKEGTQFVKTKANWDIENYYSLSGSGFNYKLGVIIKPIQQLRLGLAMHTPTWYSLTEEYSANTTYDYINSNVRSGSQITNNGYLGYNEYRLRTPWRFIASAAVVTFDKLIISADVDWTANQNIKFNPSKEQSFWNDFYDPAASNPYYYQNLDVKDYYKTSVTTRVGAEYRVLPKLSLRAGYAHTSSPVKAAAKNNQMTIYTADLEPYYEFDNDTDYVTCGLGYRYKHFYLDAAYVYKHRSSDWHNFTCDPDNPDAGGAVAKLTGNDSQVVLSMGFKF